MTGRSRARGFTLLELLVAVAILALVAVMSWRGLDEIIRTHDALARSSARIDEIERVFQRIEADALIARDARLGDGQLILQNAESSVSYSFADGVLTRRVAGAESGGVRLGGALTGVDLSVWHAHGGWGVPLAVVQREAASGVRVALHMQDGGTATRVFLLGSGL